MERVWYFGGIWCKVTEHGLADTGLALGDSGESNLISPLPGELGRMERVSKQTINHSIIKALGTIVEEMLT